MKREDLFLAIGQVEDTRLARTELTLPSQMCEEDKTMHTRPGRIFRNLLVAVLIISMLAVTAYAAVGYLLFDSPEDMISTIFGDKTGYDHAAAGDILDKDGNVLAVQSRQDRVPADENVVAEDVAPLVSPVGQTITWHGYTLTVDANLYDAGTKCGLVTYILENPDGLNYQIHGDGMVDSSMVSCNQYGYSYIIKDQSTDARLVATYYYQLRNPEAAGLEITLSSSVVTDSEEYRQTWEELKGKLRQEVPEEEAIALKKQQLGDQWDWYLDTFTREEIIESGYEDMMYDKINEVYTEEMLTCPAKILLPGEEQKEMKHITLGGGAVRISPINMTLDLKKIGDDGTGTSYPIVIRFGDGSEYVVEDSYTENRVFHVQDSEGREATIMFNRIIDVETVSSVTANHRELSLDN